VIRLHGFNNKDRIMLEESLKGKIKETEEALKSLKEVFKAFTEKNKNKISPVELDMMSKNIDLLWRNLNIIEEKLKSNNSHFRSSEINLSNSIGGLEKPLMIDDEYSGQDLTQEEIGIMNEFKQNDELLERFAKDVIKVGLDEL
jgi:SMC interacting uncharacterized protein involved in chromosome segregation